MEGGTTHGKRNIGVPLGCPPPTYIKEREEEAGQGVARQGGESYLDSRSK